MRFWREVRLAASRASRRSWIPATRTAQIEVEIQNSQFRLAGHVRAWTSRSSGGRTTLIIPANALVDVQGKRGVFRPAEGDIAKFQPIEVGLMDETQIEIASGLAEGGPDRHDRRGGAEGRRQDRPAGSARRRTRERGATAAAAAAAASPRG